MAEIFKIYFANAPDNYLKSEGSISFLNYLIIFYYPGYNVENNFPRYEYGQFSRY